MPVAAPDTALRDLARLRRVRDPAGNMIRIQQLR